MHIIYCSSCNPMPLLAFLLTACCVTAAFSQTIVPEALDDTFNLSCPACRMQVDGVSLTLGQNALPMNTQKPVARNLLWWRYYDNILGKEAYMAQEPFWTTGTQLLEEVPENENLSLHINLVWTDSAGREHRLFLVMAGLSRRHLTHLPLITVTDPQDTYAPLRFSAAVQIFHSPDQWETYDAIDGIAMLNAFDPKRGSVSGSFEFVAQRVGMEKKGWFKGGWFDK